MLLSRTVFVVYCCCTINIAYSTPFLQNLFLPSSDTTHISDYRKQHRSDSRADKSQRFTLSTDYSEQNDQVLGQIIDNAREKYETIVNNLQNFQTNARLTTTKNDTTTTPSIINGNEQINTKTKLKNQKKKHFSSLLSTIMALNKLQHNRDSNILSKYLTPSSNTKPTRLDIATETEALSSTPIMQSTTESTIIPRYPTSLLELWQNRATEFVQRKFNAKSMSFTNNNNNTIIVPTIKTISRETFDNNNNYYYSNADQYSTNNNHSADDDSQIDTTTAAVESFPTSSAAAAAAAVVNVPYQLFRIMPINKAKLAFQNAFYKYSNSMSNQHQNSNKKITQTKSEQQYHNIVDTDTTAAAAGGVISTIKDDGSYADVNLKAAGATLTTTDTSIIINGIPLGYNDYLNEETISSIETFAATTTTQTTNYDDDDDIASGASVVVRHISDDQQRRQKQKLNLDANISNNKDFKDNNANDIENIANHNNNDDDDDDMVLDENVNNNIDAETIGIFLLEIIGTVAGLTWGAFSQIQNSIFTSN